MKRRIILIITQLLLTSLLMQGSAYCAAGLKEIVAAISENGDRTTGGKGYVATSEYIYTHLEKLGLDPQVHTFPVPVREHISSTLTVSEQSFPLQPFEYNAISPQSIARPLHGDVYYVGPGSMEHLKGKPIENAIVLMDLDSGLNWQEIAALGAKACIFLGSPTHKNQFLFKEKLELTPLQFPQFWMSRQEAESAFGVTGKIEEMPSPLAKDIVISSTIRWREVMAKNIYAIIPGNDPELKNELIIVDAFYDSSAYLPGKAPGADEGASIATLLRLASSFESSPPGRSVLLLASSGHTQTLAGFREFMWSIHSRSKELRSYKKLLRNRLSAAKEKYAVLHELSFPMETDALKNRQIKEAISNNLKASVDVISRELNLLRLGDSREKNKKRIDELVKDRFSLRQLGWKEDFSQLSEEETTLLQQLIPGSISEHTRTIEEAKKHQKAFKSSQRARNLVGDYTIATVISLHLSSHGNGVGAFHQGWLYQLKPNINRTGIFSEIGDILRQAAEVKDTDYPYLDTIRGDRMHSWDTWFLGKPSHGGEVSSMAGLLGLTLATVGDARALWGTPWDTMESINWENLEKQARLIEHQLHRVSHAEKLSSGRLPRRGFSSVSGRANLLLQGELFANFPAAGTTIMAYQGLGKYYTMVDAGGFFHIRGIADRKNVVDKLIIEGYRFDEKTGEVIWAIDKKETGKANYRLKIRRQSMKTDLIMFSCTETTVFGLLEPRNFKHLTKLKLLDGRRDAPPQHYWYSRIDTRSSIIASIYTEPGTWLKLTLSDTLLTRKLILSNSSEKSPLGLGYPVDTYASIPATYFYGARDIWTLLRPRIQNLERHGIVDTQINNLQNQGIEALESATRAKSEHDHGEFKRASLQALALAGQVYVQVEKTQKDVLFGVLFYIALFVPFAFCMERFLFNYANIYKRIVAFSGILVGLIAIIYNVHPAFQLAYSPMVVILAFFIIGLSLMVTLIIFFRFEEEMILLQRRASHKQAAELSQWKAFVAAFTLGVSNLRRRKLRTSLTCLTLIILTFTIMSFTTVKSNQQPNRLLFQEDAPYQGVLMKTMNWKTLPRESRQILEEAVPEKVESVSRVWHEGKNVTRPSPVPIKRNEKTVMANGLIGLSWKEPQVTGSEVILSGGRWFNHSDSRAILLSERLAKELGLTTDDLYSSVLLWGMEFQLVGLFQGARLDMLNDLDGEPLTPVTFPQETSAALSDVEQEALESGDDVKSLQSRYRHIPGDQVAIIPEKTLLSMGGKLKSSALKPKNTEELTALSGNLAKRFNLPIFVGEENGVWFVSPSSTLSYKGVPNIVIPLLISIFIVLNTMISSVYERKNEIAVYTSVGLAPRHVSFLFIAEAMALAVISVVLGYLLAQVSAALFSQTTYWEGITVNYSSMAGVAAMLLVIGVVLISVIYPSKVAADIAIPDVKRSFTLPKPKGKTIEVMLPFFMKYEEHESIGGFIYSYFSGHQDVSHGIFSTGPVDIIFSCSTVEEIQQLILRADDPSNLHCTHIRAKVWLAPFDFGIMQEVDIQFCPARENSQYLEIKITLRRNSGEVSMWQRVNTLFIHDLRKQLLIWRSINKEAHLEYREILRMAAGIANQEQVTGV